MLPSEICVYILKIRNNIRNDASKKIQNAWKNYISEESSGIDFALLMEINENNQINICISTTAIILKKSLSTCSGKFYLESWRKIAEKLYNSFKLYDYPDNQWLTAKAINYRKTKIEYNKLIEKFNFNEFNII